MRVSLLVPLALLLCASPARAYTDADLVGAYNDVFTAEDGSFVTSLNLVGYMQDLAKQAVGQLSSGDAPLDLDAVRALPDRALLALVYQALLGRFTQSGVGTPYPPCAAVIDTATGRLRRREPESHNCTLINVLLIIAIIGLVYSWKRGTDAQSDAKRK